MAKSEIEIQYVQMLILLYIFAIDHLIFIKKAKKIVNLDILLGK